MARTACFPLSSKIPTGICLMTSPKELCYIYYMKLTPNRFVIANITCTLIFILSLFGVFDWALASVIMIVGVGLSTFFGSFLYSKQFINGIVCRSIFSLGIISTGYVFFQLGTYLNQNVYDGLITLTLFFYILLATLLLHFLGKKTL